MNQAMFTHLDGLGSLGAKPRRGLQKKGRAMKRFSKPSAVFKSDEKKRRARELSVLNAQYKKDAKQAREDYQRASDADFQPFWNEKYESPWKPVESSYKNLQTQDAPPSLAPFATASPMFSPQANAAQSYVPQAAAPQVLAPIESPATDYSAVAFALPEMQDSSAVEWGGFVPTDSNAITDTRYDTEEPFAVYGNQFDSSSHGFDGVPVAAKKMLSNVRRKNPTLANLFNEQLKKHDLTAGRDSFAGLSEGETQSAWADFGKGMGKIVTDTASAYGRLAVDKIEAKRGKLSVAEKQRVENSYAGKARDQLSSSPMGDYYPIFLMVGVLGVGYFLLKKK